jgi:hypothetical protein
MKKPLKKKAIYNPEPCKLVQRMLDMIDALSNDKRFKFIASGRHRSVFLHIGKSYVVKVARTIDGLQANCDELRLFRRPSKIPMARCRRLSDIAIVMEYVEEELYSPYLPTWTKHVDCCQVGFAKSGKLVAYDYSII